MNENLPPKTQTYNSWLREATTQLTQAGIESARLDAEILLAHTVRQPRTYLHAHDDETLSDSHIQIANARLDLRCGRTPIAYIIGHREFYGRRFKTTPAALIPRPESEEIIILLSKIIPKNNTPIPKTMQLVDVGTGTGCLGITAKLEWPELDVTLIDTSTHALNLAKENAKLLGADIKFKKNDLLSGYGLTVDIIIANLPYVDPAWEVSPDTQFEPQEALYANNGGLSLIYRLIDQASVLLKTHGYLLLESDPRQHDAIEKYAKSRNLEHLKNEGFVSLFTRS